MLLVELNSNVFPGTIFVWKFDGSLLKNTQKTLNLFSLFSFEFFFIFLLSKKRVYVKTKAIL